tara:strand:+ start:1621 stop:3165 length:1545 start_codon:yes stop_codon:yes gene_type:complete
MENIDKNLNENNNLDSQLQTDKIDINLNDIIESLLRRKIYFFSTILIILGFGFNKTFDKPTWQGEFQIVIKNDNSSGMGGSSLKQLQSSSSLLSFLNNTGGTSLKTEVKILESPSVLNPIFNFVKKEKKLKNQNSKLKFKKWKNSLSVELFDGTSVLNLIYTDTDKDLIIPVLNKLSKAYQEYSNRDKKSNLNQGIKYLEEQSNILKKTSQNSFNELMKFSIENNFISSSQINSFTESSSKEEGTLPFNFSSTKYAPNASKLLYLSELEAFALEKSYVFKKDSNYMIQLNKKIKKIKDSISKPTEKLIQYRNLSKKANMDELLSINLAKQLELLKIEKGREQNPWELISAPTMLDFPVAPRKLRIMATSMLLGIFFGTIFSLLIDKKSKLIFNENQIQKLIPYPFLRKINIKNKDFLNKLIRMLLKNDLNIKEVVLVPIVDENYRNEILNELNFINENIEKRKVLISNDFEKNKDKEHILMIKKSKSSLILLEEYLKDLKLLSTSVLGWVFLED